MSSERLDPEVARAIAMTRIIRPPRRALATFGSTVINYHVVSPPVYAELMDEIPRESVVRHGVVKADRPQIVTPGYLSRTEGFGQEASEYLNYLIDRYGSESTGLLYKYKNEPESTDSVSGDPLAVAKRIQDDLEQRDSPLDVVILGIGELWDVSVMKFIYEFTDESARTNFSDLNRRGLLDDDGGVPRDARRQIEDMLRRARRGELDPSEVHAELVRWRLFEDYQRQFFDLFRRKP